MQVREKQLKKQKLQRARKNSQSGNKRSRQNGNSETGTYAPSWSTLGLSVLTKELKPVTSFEASLRAGHDNYFNILTIIDTEEKQLQAIEDLYSIVKAQPKYRKLKEPNWTEQDSPVKVLIWLLRKLGPLARGMDWTIDSYKEGKKIRYQFVIYKHYSGYDIRYGVHYLALDFLPFLKKKDEHLHNLIVDTVALVSKVNKVPLWHEDGDYSKFLTYWLENAGVAEEFLSSAQVLSYRQGVAAQYLQLIRKRMRQVTREVVARSLLEYKDNSQRKTDVCWFIRKGLDLANRKTSIIKNSFIPSFRQGRAITPYRHYKFIWSSHEHDIVSGKADAQLEKDEREHKKIPPMMFSITKPGMKVKDIDPDDFPCWLSNFLWYGNRLFTGRYKFYFYKDMLEDHKTPTENFMMLDAPKKSKEEKKLLINILT